jgi:hypothetical protein
MVVLQGAAKTMATSTKKTKATATNKQAAKKSATKKANVRAQGATGAKKAKPASETTTQAPKEGRKATVLALIGRKEGATLPEIMAATGWQAHSVRGLISTLGSKEGLKIASTKNEAGERVYQHQA